LFFVGLFFVNCCLFTGAQFSPVPAAQSGTSSGSSTVLISARNKDGTPAQLSQGDLEVRINGKQATVGEVRFLGRPAVRYCLLFDTSGSQRVGWTQQQSDAAALLKIAQPGRDYGMLVSFSNEGYLDAESTDPQELIRALSKEIPRGGTALYDAVVASSDHLSKTATESELRVMFILSDGDDNASHVSGEEALQTLVGAGVRVYAIRPRGIPHVSSRGAAALRDFGDKTGGMAYFPKKDKDLKKVFDDISSNLSGVFAVTFTPGTDPRNRPSKLEIKCAKQGVSLIAPRGYFTPQQ
jgi:VWFA-related protein